MEENREMMELLRRIEKANRRQALSGWIMCVVAVVTALCCVMLFMTVVDLLPQINTVIAQTETVLSNLEQTTEQFSAMDLQGMVADVDTLVLTGQDSLEQTMEKLNTIDFEALNQAIEDLSDVIEPLARFFKAFG